MIAFLLAFSCASLAAHADGPPRGDGSLALHNLHLGESVSVRYRRDDGSYDFAALERLRYALRCRQTLETHEIPIGLIELVDVIQDRFGGGEVEVVSGYRSPELNGNLRAQGRAVAKASRHMLGEAMDIRMRGISVSEIRKYALELRRGGVGFYPADGFVHVDVGPVRRW